MTKNHIQKTLYAQWLCLAILSLLCSNQVLAQGDTQELPKVETINKELLAGFSKLNFRRGPTEKPGPGSLLSAGCKVSESKHIRINYQSSNNRFGEVNVQIVFYSKDYAYAINDLYLFFANAAGLTDPINEAGIGKTEQLHSLVVERVLDQNTPQHIMLVLTKNKPGISGFAGWYHINDRQTTSVLIAFEHLEAPPWDLIDGFLDHFSSNIVRESQRLARCVTEDLHKWINLLQTSGHDYSTMHRATLHLRRYDAQAFGLMRGVPWTKTRHSPRECANAAQSAIDKMRDWLEQRPKTKDPG